LGKLHKTERTSDVRIDCHASGRKYSLSRVGESTVDIVVLANSLLDLLVVRKPERAVFAISASASDRRTDGGETAAWFRASKKFRASSALLRWK
jgi:hypothetical protein